MSDSQRLAVYALVTGKSDGEAAKAAGVCRQTLSAWRGQFLFIRELNIERNKSAQLIMQRLRTRMTAMTEAALTGIASAIKRGDRVSMRWWLDSIGIDEHAKRIFEQSANPEIHPEGLDAVIDELAAQRVDAFLTARGIGALERLRVREALTAREAECLKGEHDNPKPEKEI